MSSHASYDALYNLLQSLKFSLYLFCLTETRIRDQPLFNISLPGYSFVHVNSQTAAGGVAVYISNRFNYKFYEKQFRLHKAESIWLNISGCHQNCIVGVIYRHPSLTEINKFLNDLSSSLFELSNCNKSFYLLGDVNININQNNRTTVAIDYINVLLCHGAFPVITIPTRVTSTFASVIDHIISNDLKHEILLFVLRECLAGHYPVACYVKALNPKISKNQAKIIYF